MNKLLQSYLRDEISKTEFSVAICKISGLMEKVGRSRFLHLKHGDKVATLELFQKENDCGVCKGLNTDDLANSCHIRQALDKHLSASDLEWTIKPNWYSPHLAKKNPYGAQGFFSCSQCGSIIEVCEPERMLSHKSFITLPAGYKGVKFSWK